MIPPPLIASRAGGVDSDLMKELAPTRMELNVCKRSDAALHWLNILCPSSTLETMLAEARRSCHYQGDPVICVTRDNRRRQEINEETNKSLATPDSQLLEAPKARTSPMLSPLRAGSGVWLGKIAAD